MNKFAISILGLFSLSNSQLGAEDSFAQHLPSDCALYFEVYNEEGLLPKEVGELLGEAENLQLEKLDEMAEKLPLDEEAILSVSEALGSNLVFAVGGASNEAIGQSGKLYQEFSALAAGWQTEFLISLAQEFKGGESDPSETIEKMVLGDDFGGIDQIDLGLFLDSLMKDGRFVLPSVYLAFKPREAELNHYWKELDKAKREALADPEFKMADIEVAEQKWPISGLTVKKDKSLSGEMREWWEALDEKERGPFDEKRFQKLEAAVDSLELTLMWARVDGWFVLYVGNGQEGFRLIDVKEESMANDGKLSQITALSKDADAWMRWRVSQGLLEQLPNWLNDSSSFRAQAAVLKQHTELKNQQAMTDSLYEIAKSRSLLSKRKVDSDWYGIGWVKNGLRIETVGGMRRPGLDYDAEWTLSEGAKSTGSLFRAQWVGDRSREKWGWQQTSGWVNLVSAALAEWMPEELPISRDLISEDLMGWMASMSESGQKMSVEGLGRECVLAVDLLGEMPQVPDVSDKVLQDGRIPRVLFARTVADREKVAAEGQQMLTNTQDLWKKVEEEMGAEFPFPGVLTSQENGLKTSFILVPFSNDDLVPCVNLGEDILIYSTSRKQAQSFQLNRKKKATSQTGLLVELDLSKAVDYVKLWDDLDDSDILSLDQADALLDTLGQEQEESVEDQMAKVQTLRYHHRMEEGELRTSFALEIKP